MIDWKIGQHIVCVDAAPRYDSAAVHPEYFIAISRLHEREVYVIRDLVSRPYVPGAALGVRLEEVSNCDLTFVFEEYAYFWDRFRPLTSAEQRAMDATTLRLLASIKTPEVVS